MFVGCFVPPSRVFGKKGLALEAAAAGWAFADLGLLFRSHSLYSLVGVNSDKKEEGKKIKEVFIKKTVDCTNLSFHAMHLGRNDAT